MASPAAMTDREHATTATASSFATSTRRERPCDACRRRKARCVKLDRETGPLCVLCSTAGKHCTFVDRPPPRKRRVASVDTTRDAGKIIGQEEGSMVRALPVGAELEVGVGRSRDVDSGRGGSCRLTAGPTASARLDTAPDFPLVRHRRAEQDPSFHYEYARLNRILAGQTDILVELYFRFVHPSYPVIDRSAFLNHCRDNQTLDPLLLGVVCLLGSEYWQERLSSRSLVGPDVTGLIRFVSSLQSDGGRRKSLETLQAGLLLLQLPERQNWEDVVRVVEEANELGVFSESAAVGAVSRDSMLRRRVAWACYIQDKWGALMHGQDCLLLPTRWDVKPLALQDLQDDPGAEADSTDDADRAMSRTDARYAVNQVFFEMMKLSNIIVDILHTSEGQDHSSYSESDRRQPTRLLLMDVKPVQMKLKQWYASLPDRRLKDQSYSAMSPESTTLHLAYLSAEIALHRRIVTSLDTREAGPHLTHIVRAAAKTRLLSATEFVNRLRPAQLAAFWGYASAGGLAMVGVFAGVLMSTAATSDEAAFYHARLEEYRWTLGVCCRHAAFVDEAAAMLDVCIAALEQAESP